MPIWYVASALNFINELRAQLLAMAEEDIYGNKAKWEKWIISYINEKKILVKPKKEERRKYYCKNKSNFKYYKKLIRSFEVDDLSCIRRGRLKDVMNFLCHNIEVDLKDVNSIEKEDIIIKLRKNTAESQLKRTEREVKKIGRILFGEEDMPNFFKEFKIKVDRSRQKRREDKLTYEEFDGIMKFFSGNNVLQAFLSIVFETLVRPQELLYTKIRDVEFQDNYGFISISEHGKEGIKKLLCIDSFPYLLKMFNSHKKRKDKGSFLFLNEHKNQLTPKRINEKIKFACEKLKIDKPITCYSFKRFGVTFRVLRGDDPQTIQKVANWTSLKMLSTYDLSDQQDFFKLELAKRGLIKDDKLKQYQPKTKTCEYCGELVGFAESTCPKCSHITDRSMIKERIEKDNEMVEFIKGIQDLKETNPKVFEIIKNIGKEKGVIS